MKNWADNELPKATNDLRKLKFDIDEFGYCIAANAISEEQVTQIRRRIDGQARAERKQGLIPLDGVQSEGDGNQWVYMLINKGQVFLDLLRATQRRPIPWMEFSTTWLGKPSTPTTSISTKPICDWG